MCLYSMVPISGNERSRHMYIYVCGWVCVQELQTVPVREMHIYLQDLFIRKAFSTPELYLV